MPLLDHFRAPLRDRRPWEGVHALWASEIATTLNESVLPEYYVAIPKTKMGIQVEADVSAYEETWKRDGLPNGAVATPVYAPPKPPFVAPLDFTDLDIFEVQIGREEGGLTLVAAIEIVSPANKDRPSHIEAFTRKCASYLQEGISVVVVDIVTNRKGNFHHELVRTLARKEMGKAAERAYAVSYRTVEKKRKIRLEAWPYELKIGKPLPTVPLWIASDLVLPLQLEQSYRKTCKGLRITG